MVQIHSCITYTLAFVGAVSLVYALQVRYSGIRAREDLKKRYTLLTRRRPDPNISPEELVDLASDPTG